VRQINQRQTLGVDCYAYWSDGGLIWKGNNITKEKDWCGGDKVMNFPGGDRGKMEVLRPIPDGDFELIPFGDDPTKCFKLGKGIPELARAQPIACLRENVDIFTWSAADMWTIVKDGERL
jgi:hypothetical protein